MKGRSMNEPPSKPGDTFHGVHIYTNLEKRGMDVFFVNYEGPNEVITDVIDEIFIPENYLRFISEGAIFVQKDLKQYPIVSSKNENDNITD